MLREELKNMAIIAEALFVVSALACFVLFKAEAGNALLIAAIYCHVVRK